MSHKKSWTRRLYPVRLECWCIRMYHADVPAVGAEVVCTVCGEQTEVMARYYWRNRVSLCGAQARQSHYGTFITAQCTLGLGHEGDHYDRPMGLWFTSTGKRRLHSSSEGLVNHA